MRPFRHIRRSLNPGTEQGGSSQAQAGATPGTVAARSPSPRGWGNTFSSLANPRYRILWLSTLFSMAALNMSMVAQPFLVYHKFRSAVDVGLVAAALGVPMVLLAPLGGLAADRLDKRKVFLVSQFCSSVLGVSITVLVLLDVFQVWHLVLIGILQGSVFAFNAPARQAYIPEVVGRENLGNALSLEAAAMSLNRIVAPSVAGVLLAWNPSAAFMASAILYVASALLFMGLPPTRKSARSLGGSRGIMSGFRYVLSRPILLALLGLGLLSTLLGLPYQQLLPVFQTSVLHVGPEQLGLMYTAIGVGGLAGSLVAAALSDSPRQGLVQIIGCIGFGVSLVLFALSPVYGVSLAFLVLVGFTSQVYLTINRVMILLNTEPAYYGRVTSVWFMVFALTPAAVLPMGVLVDALGPQKSVAGAAALLIVSTVAMAVVYPPLWHRRPRTPVLRSQEDAPREA